MSNHYDTFELLEKKFSTSERPLLSYRQGSLAYQLSRYLKIHLDNAKPNSWRQKAIDFFDKDFNGFCAGISNLWLMTRYISSIENSRAEHPNNNNYEWMKKTLEKIRCYRGKKIKEGDKDIEQLIQFVRYFQSPDIVDGYPRRQQDVEKYVQFTSGVELETEATFCDFCTLETLAGYLKAALLAKKMVTIGLTLDQGLHACALFFDGKNYHYFDTNRGKLEESSPNIHQALTPLFRMYASQGNKGLPVSVKVLTTKKPEELEKGEQKELDLLKRQATPIALREEALSTLVAAARNGNLYKVKQLVEKTSKLGIINTLDLRGKQPLQMAVEFGHLSIVKYLIEKARANVMLNKTCKQNILQIASLFGHLDIVKYCLETVGFQKISGSENDARLPMDYAVRGGSLDVMTYFVLQQAKLSKSSGLLRHFPLAGTVLKAYGLSFSKNNLQPLRPKYASMLRIISENVINLITGQHKKFMTAFQTAEKNWPNDESYLAKAFLFIEKHFYLNNKDVSFELLEAWRIAPKAAESLFRRSPTAALCWEIIGILKAPLKKSVITPLEGSTSLVDLIAVTKALQFNKLNYLKALQENVASVDWEQEGLSSGHKLWPSARTPKSIAKLRAELKFTIGKGSVAEQINSLFVSAGKILGRADQTNSVTRSKKTTEFYKAALQEHKVIAASDKNALDESGMIEVRP